jgi:hypothetical protein
MLSALKLDDAAPASAAGIKATGSSASGAPSHQQQADEEADLLDLIGG